MTNIEIVNENMEVFDQLEDTSEETGIKQIDTEDVFGELSGSVQRERILLPGDEQKTFTIERVEVRKPYIRDNDGNPIPPKSISPSDSTKIGYSSSLAIYTIEGNYLLNVSGITFFVRKENGKTIYTPWFRMNDLTEESLNDNYTSGVSKLFYKYCKKKNLDMKTVSAKAFQEGLVGMKVKLKNKQVKFAGKPFNKIEIIDFV